MNYLKSVYVCLTLPAILLCACETNRSTFRSADNSKQTAIEEHQAKLEAISVQNEIEIKKIRDDSATEVSEIKLCSEHVQSFIKNTSSPIALSDDRTVNVVEVITDLSMMALIGGDLIVKKIDTSKYDQDMSYADEIKLSINYLDKQISHNKLDCVDKLYGAQLQELGINR